MTQTRPSRSGKRREAHGGAGHSPQPQGVGFLTRKGNQTPVGGEEAQAHGEAVVSFSRNQRDVAVTLLKLSVPSRGNTAWPALHPGPVRTHSRSPCGDGGRGKGRGPAGRGDGKGRRKRLGRGKGAGVGDPAHWARVGVSPSLLTLSLAQCPPQTQISKPLAEAPADDRPTPGQGGFEGNGVKLGLCRGGAPAHSPSQPVLARLAVSPSEIPLFSTLLASPHYGGRLEREMVGQNGGSGNTDAGVGCRSRRVPARTAQGRHPRRNQSEHKLAKMRNGAMRSNGAKSSTSRQDKFTHKILTLNTDVRRGRVVSVW